MNMNAVVPLPKLSSGRAELKVGARLTEKLVNREIETVVLMYINPINSRKYVTSFSWIFHFWLIDFSKKSWTFFFQPYELLLGYMDLCKMLEVKKINFWSRSRLLPRLLRLD